jgi:arabinose-5-phosphate isomerase
MRVDDNVPRVAPGTAFTDVMREMSVKGMGATAIVGGRGEPIGVFTDGDLRRLIEKGTDPRMLTAADVMRPAPRTIRADRLAAEAADVMEQYKINCMLVVDASGMLVGAFNSNDLMRAKVI